MGMVPIVKRSRLGHGTLLRIGPACSFFNHRQSYIREPKFAAALTESFARLCQLFEETNLQHHRLPRVIGVCAHKLYAGKVGGNLRRR